MLWNKSVLCLACIGFAVGVQAADLTLADGRVLKNWRVMSVSPGYLTIRYDGGAVKIQKELLPPEVRARYPVDEAAAAEERRENEEARQKRIEDLEQNAGLPNSMQERVRRYREGKEKERLRNIAEAKRIEEERENERLAEIERERAAEKQQKLEESLSRDGLLLARVRTNLASAVVTMKNTSKSLQTFEWRQLRARFRGGQVREPSNIVVTDKQFGFQVEPGKTRTFEVAFGTRSYGDGDWLDEIAWKDGVWLGYQDPENLQRPRRR